MTEKEIDIAIERSGTAGDATAVVPAVQPAQNVLPVVQAPVAGKRKYGHLKRRFRDPENDGKTLDY